MSRKRLCNELDSDESDDNIVNSKKKRNSIAKAMDINVESNEKGKYTRANNKKTESKIVS